MYPFTPLLLLSLATTSLAAPIEQLNKGLHQLILALLALCTTDMNAEAHNPVERTYCYNKKGYYSCMSNCHFEPLPWLHPILPPCESMCASTNCQKWDE